MLCRFSRHAVAGHPLQVRLQRLVFGGDCIEKFEPTRSWTDWVEVCRRDLGDVILAARRVILAGLKIDCHCSLRWILNAVSSTSHWSVVAACRRSARARRSIDATTDALATSGSMVPAFENLRATSRAKSKAASVVSNSHCAPFHCSQRPQAAT